MPKIKTTIVMKFDFLHDVPDGEVKRSDAVRHIQGDIADIRQLCCVLASLDACESVSAEAVFASDEDDEANGVFLMECPMCGRMDTVHIFPCYDVGCCDGSCTEECEERCFMVLCNASEGGCGASGGAALTEDEAMAKWNERK